MTPADILRRHLDEDLMYVVLESLGLAGFAIVPVTATEEMIAAAWHDQPGGWNAYEGPMPEDAWSKMVEAYVRSTRSGPGSRS